MLCDPDSGTRDAQIGFHLQVFKSVLRAQRILLGHERQIGRVVHAILFCLHQLGILRLHGIAKCLELFGTLKGQHINAQTAAGLGSVLLNFDLQLFRTFLVKYSL